jgi:hypothetical protein
VSLAETRRCLARLYLAINFTYLFIQSVT